MKKKIFALIMSLILCLLMTANVFAAEIASIDTPSSADSQVASSRSISGYGHVVNVSNRSSSFTVPVTVTSGNGYGLTIKTTGSGTVTVAVKKPSGSYLALGSAFNSKNWVLDGNAEKQKSFKNIEEGNYIVEYSVIGGPSTIECYIYG